MDTFAVLNKNENYINAFCKILYSVRDDGTCLIAQHCMNFIPKVKYCSKVNSEASTLPFTFHRAGRI